SIAESLARQSQLQPQKGGHGSENEIKDLKEKLRTVFKEYDIVLSENYSLRAKVKHLTRQLRDPDKADLHDMPDADSHMTITPEVSKPALHLYDDTRLITIAAMDTDDQSESTDAIAR
ncbi:MAG: hypothetical protein MUF22_06220, partial [Chitinispirillaceae bacterium]|nr:hypothetical protein [Chitinispirillaceae bacterium]